MASGKLGSMNLTTGTDNLLCTIPNDGWYTVNIRCTNRTVTDLTVRIAIGSGGAPADGDYIDYDLKVPANGIVEDQGIICSAGENVWVRPNGSGMSARAHGAKGG